MDNSDPGQSKKIQCSIRLPMLYLTSMGVVYHKEWWIKTLKCISRKRDYKIIKKIE